MSNQKPAQSQPAATCADEQAEYDAWYDEQIRLGLEDIDAGRLVSHEEVMKSSQRRLAELERKYAKKAK